MPRRFSKGDELFFHSEAGRKFAVVVADPKQVKGKIAVQVAGDPFPVMVKIAQLSEGDATMPASEARDLAKKARLLRIPGWQSMKVADLRIAVESAENGTLVPSKKVASAKKGVAVPTKAKVAKSAAKKVNKKTGVVSPRKARPVKKVAKARTVKKVAKKVVAASAPSNGTNPFRVGSNVWKMAEELLRGGKRADMIKRLKKSMPLHPWSKDKEENPDRAIDKRLLMTAAAMEKDYGYKIVREGRGAAGTIQVLPPGKKPVAKKGTSKARSKATTSGTRRR